MLLGLPAADRTLLNVSYDSTRGFYADYNEFFATWWKMKTGESVVVRQSHGPSCTQARAVIGGLMADVASLAIEDDLQAVHRQIGGVPTDWRSHLPGRNSPYTTTIAFLVRKGNPKRIRDWDDLIRPGVSVVTPNPMTSGAGRLSFLAAGAFARRKHGQGEAARAFVSKLYWNAPVLDPGSRSAAHTFVHRGLGDVLLAWENDAMNLAGNNGRDEFDLVSPSLGIRAEPAVAVLCANAIQNENIDLARAYLEQLYTSQGQRMLARHFLRPLKPEHADSKDLERFSKLELVSVGEAFSDWPEAWQTQYAENEAFNEICRLRSCCL